MLFVLIDEKEREREGKETNGWCKPTYKWTHGEVKARLYMESLLIRLRVQATLGPFVKYNVVATLHQ